MTEPHDGQPDQASVLPESRAGAVRSLDDLSVIRALEDYCEALQQGQRPDRQQLLEKYPELARELAQCLDALELVRHIGPPLEEGESDQLDGARANGGLPGRHTLGDFRLVREIGRGGMGVVYEAEQISLKRRVALKVLPFAAMLDQKYLQRFRNEAQAAAALKHPNIVGIHSVGCERGVNYYAMEFIEGRTLAQVIEELREKQAAGSGQQAAGKGTEPTVSLGTQRR